MFRGSIKPWIAGAVLLATLTAPAALGSHGGDVHITLTAGEGDDCPDDKSFCLRVTEGALSELGGGDDVQLALENPTENDLSHNAHVTTLSEADEGGDTPASAAFANTPTESPGGSATVEFTVPDGVDTDGAYIWCNVGAHESGGMWLTTEGSGDGGDDANGSPGFTALGALAGVALALFVAGRRR